MRAHVFGGSSSPSCSNFALRRTLIDNDELYGKVVATILERNFYIDDMLKSFPTAEEAITVIKQVKDLCSNGDFNLTKLKQRQIIQQLCQKKLQCDEQIDERSAYDWLKWKDNLLTLENLAVPRC